MIDRKRVQDTVDMVASLPDAEQEAVYEQMSKLRAKRRYAERLAEIGRYMTKFEQEGDMVYPYDPATGTVSDTPVFKQGRIERTG